MEIERKELLDALDLVKSAVANKEILEQSDSFVFTSKGTVHSFNDDVAISTDSPLKMDGAVKAKELLAFLNKSKEEVVNIDITKNELRLKSKRVRAGLRLAAEILLPIDEIPKPGKGKWESLPSNFSSALKRCQISCSRDMSKPGLACIRLSGSKAESCDGERISIFDFGKDYFEDAVLLPYYAAQVLIGLPLQVYQLSKGWIHFGLEDVHERLTISCRIFDTAYPDLSKHVSFKGSPLKIPKEMLEVLERAQIFSDQDIKQRQFIDVRIKDNQCLVSAKNNNGWIREVVKIKYSGKTLEFRINPIILKDILKLVNKAVIGDTSMKFRSKNFVHVVTLAVGE